MKWANVIQIGDKVPRETLAHFFCLERPLLLQNLAGNFPPTLVLDTGPGKYPREESREACTRGTPNGHKRVCTGMMIRNGAVDLFKLMGLTNS